MNNKDAIFYLNQVREDYEYKEFFEGREALDLAIKALEEQERPTGKKKRDAYWDEAMKWHDRLEGGRE